MKKNCKICQLLEIQERGLLKLIPVKLETIAEMSAYYMCNTEHVKLAKEIKAQWTIERKQEISKIEEIIKSARNIYTTALLQLELKKRAPNNIPEKLFDLELCVTQAKKVLAQRQRRKRELLGVKTV